MILLVLLKDMHIEGYMMRLLIYLSLLMRRIISYAKKQGLDEIYGEVLSENSVMISICKRVGFLVSDKLDDPGIVDVRLNLKGQT